MRVPAIVVSGEGTKRQTIEALRLGAIDWIDKSAASIELEERCRIALDDALGHGPRNGAANHLPTPVAQRLAGYSQRIGTDWQAIEGLRALEAILRFVAILGLSSTPPFPFPAVAKQIIRPSMGTWLTICGTLAEAAGAGKTFLRLASCVMPDRQERREVQAQVQMRNAIVHSGYSPSSQEVGRLHELLARFAHRANSSWRSTLAVPIAMTHDGAEFAISVLRFGGTGLPWKDIIVSPSQALTGQPVLIEPPA